jgi:hypothetical protein
VAFISTLILTELYVKGSLRNTPEICQLGVPYGNHMTCCSAIPERATEARTSSMPTSGRAGGPGPMRRFGSSLLCDRQVQIKDILFVRGVRMSEKLLQALAGALLVGTILEPED